jgi:hypothetical protein
MHFSFFALHELITGNVRYVQDRKKVSSTSFFISLFNYFFVKVRDLTKYIFLFFALHELITGNVRYVEDWKKALPTSFSISLVTHFFTKLE